MAATAIFTEPLPLWSASRNRQHYVAAHQANEARRPRFGSAGSRRGAGVVLVHIERFLALAADYVDRARQEGAGRSRERVRRHRREPVDRRGPAGAALDLRAGEP